MKIYDKASWHIDGSENISDVIFRFREIFEFLKEKDLLTLDGEETYEFRMDSSVSLNSTMVNEEGQDFLDQYYDIIIGEDIQNMKEKFISMYQNFQKEKFEDIEWRRKKND